MLFVLVANIDNTAEQVQKNKIFETFDGEKNKTMLICVRYCGLIFNGPVQLYFRRQHSVNHRRQRSKIFSALRRRIMWQLNRQK